MVGEPRVQTRGSRPGPTDQCRSRQAVVVIRGLASWAAKQAPSQLDIGFDPTFREELGGAHGGDLLRDRCDCTDSAAQFPPSAPLLWLCLRRIPRQKNNRKERQIVQ